MGGIDGYRSKDRGCRVAYDGDSEGDIGWDIAQGAFERMWWILREMGGGSMSIVGE